MSDTEIQNLREQLLASPRAAAHRCHHHHTANSTVRGNAPAAELLRTMCCLCFCMLCGARGNPEGVLTCPVSASLVSGCLDLLRCTGDGDRAETMSVLLFMLCDGLAV